jgi:hypothetical protein
MNQDEKLNLHRLTGATKSGYEKTVTGIRGSIGIPGTGLSKRNIKLF